MIQVSEAAPDRTDHNFIRTYSGRQFWPLNPRACDIDIFDIAHALAQICRFTGHTCMFYSVADHSLRVSHFVEQMILMHGSSAGVRAMATEMALWGLLHDASEAYLCDLPTPIKHAPGIGQLYQLYEARLQQCIVNHFDLFPDEPALVKEADRLLLLAEMRDLMTAPSAKGIAGCIEKIVPLDARDAEAGFYSRFCELVKSRTRSGHRSVGVDHE